MAEVPYDEYQLVLPHVALVRVTNMKDQRSCCFFLFFCKELHPCLRVWGHCGFGCSCRLVNVPSYVVTQAKLLTGNFISSHHIHIHTVLHHKLTQNETYPQNSHFQRDLKFSLKVPAEDIFISTFFSLSPRSRVKSRKLQTEANKKYIKK